MDQDRAEEIEQLKAEIADLEFIVEGLEEDLQCLRTIISEAKDDVSDVIGELSRIARNL